MNTQKTPLYPTPQCEMFSDVLPTFSEVRVLFQTANNEMLWPRVLVKGSQPRVFKNVLTTETPCVRDGYAPACGKKNKSTSVYDCPQCQQNKNRTVVSDQQLQRKPTRSSRQKIEDCIEDTRMRSALISALLPLPPFTCTRRKKTHAFDLFRSVSGRTAGVRDARSSELDPSLRRRKQKHWLPSETCGKKHWTRRARWVRMWNVCRKSSPRLQVPVSSHVSTWTSSHATVHSAAPFRSHALSCRSAFC